MGSRLKIALTADPEIPVPPLHYGGIERIVDLIARGLTLRGHEVTLFAHPDSDTPARLIAWPGRSSGSRVDTMRNATLLARNVFSGDFDVIHSFSRLAYLSALLPLGLPKIMSYQREISPDTVNLAYGLSRGSLSFTAISHWMIKNVKHIGHWDMVPNGVPLDRYDCRGSVGPDAPLVFLGRIEEIKGPHLAIEIARRSGLKLVIAGNIPDEKRAWVEAHVLPHVDGDHVRYIGAVDDAQKNSLLSQAAALLMPILWEEPFGIVMAEAMACGTPVLGLARGAVPEVVEDGVTGFVRDSVDDLVGMVGQLAKIDRLACRARVEQLYSDEVIVDRYLEVYERAIGP